MDPKSPLRSVWDNCLLKKLVTISFLCYTMKKESIYQFYYYQSNVLEEMHAVFLSLRVIFEENCIEKLAKNNSHCLKSFVLDTNFKRYANEIHSN